ncbi:hypothetical protein CS0771_54410 [Catellatospora sp. IY07-71]|nr:hypothetical protein CS0771_54410 [Catellatospora sp. IY07-71]
MAEDGGNVDINVISAYGSVAPFLRLPGQDASEITGPVFSPSGDRLYFSSQRGPSGCARVWAASRTRSPARSGADG